MDQAAQVANVGRILTVVPVHVLQAQVLVQGTVELVAVQVLQSHVLALWYVLGKP